MSHQSSIPHLARAILEKRSSQICRFNQYKVTGLQVRQQSSRQTSTPKIPQPSLRTSKQSTKNWPAQLTTIEDPIEARRVSFFFKCVGTFAFFTSLYGTYLYVNWTNSVATHAASDHYLPFNADVSNRWKDLNRDFDDEVEMSEKLMFMKNKRRRLIQRAYGNVLEVSAGTGRNLDFYDLRGFLPTNQARRNIITHLTLNDQSDVIIAAAEEKLETILSRQEQASTAKVDFVVGDAGISGVIQRPEGGFDTIIQTMGVCSMVDPVGFLRKMGQLCRQPGERSKMPERWRAKDDDGNGGQILLLEHGRGYFDWLNWILDTGASLHAHRFGCWWNKDIEQIIKQSGLKIEKIKRYHSGTTWMIVLRPQALNGGVERDARVENIQVTQTRLFSQK